jgi:prevent-host-death family protein
MCYLFLMDDRVGVRELRQDLSRYLRRVRAGERLVVTERGHPLAVLIPWADERNVLDGLIASGRARRGDGRLLEIAPVSRPVSGDGSAALALERQEKA